MKSIVRITAALVILGICSAESSSSAAETTSRSLVSPLAHGAATTEVAPLKKAPRKKVPPPKSLNPIKISNIPSESLLGRKLLEKTRRAAYNNNAYGGYNSYNKNNGNYATYGYSNGNYNANQAQYNSNSNNGGSSQQYQGSSGSAASAYNSNYWNQAGFEEWSITQSQWLKDFSVKFEGCHKITEWNKEAQDVDDMRVKTRQLVRFKMCPTAYCNAATEGGCENGYGEYVIDLETFLESYIEAKEEYDEYMDAYTADQYNNEQNQQQQNGYYNYYYQQNEQNAQGLDIADYLTCQALDINYNGDAENGYYNGQQNQDDAEWDGTYYIGPVCGSQGGQIHLGVFKDEECTVAADSTNGANLYLAATGYKLPFSTSNMIELDCVPCSDLDLSDDDGGNGENADNYDSAVSDWCEDLYQVSGKCESSLPYGTVVNANNQACNYVAGVKVLRQDGTILTTTRNSPRSVSTSNKAAAAFIGLFTAATALLTAYACYLKTKLDRASIALLE